MQGRVQRLAEFDIVTRASGRVPAALAQLLFGLACAGLFVLVRTGVDKVAPTAGPFAPIYPLVLIATLFGRWRAGLVTYLSCFAWAWFVVLPRAAGLGLVRPSDTTRTAVSAATVLVVLVFAEIFRTAVRRAVAQRESAIGLLRQREAELERLNSGLEAEVAERTRELTRIWRVSPDLLGIINPDGQIEARNPAWQAILGWPEDAFRTMAVAQLVHPDDLSATRAAWERITSGSPAVRLENRLRRADGDWRWLSWVIVPEDDKFFCTARDVTLEKQQGEELAAVQETLRQSQKLEAIGQLTGGVAHDFNNLLTVIRGSVELLRRPGVSDDKRARYVSAIGETADRAAKLTGQLLAFARRQTLKPETFDCSASVLDIAAMVRTLVGARIAVTTAVPDAPCFINADRSQFETAIVNMAVNARDAMDGEGRLSIAVGPAAGIPAARAHGPLLGDFIAVTIADTGAGIAADDLHRIFEPFFTTKEQGKGTGLGLSQVIGFAKQSGGDVRVDSVEGEGTAFTMYLPRAAAAEPLPPAAPAAAPGPDGEGVCVLVVEDNVQVGAFAVQALEEIGYASVLARDADEALRQLEADSARFQVVFSDVVMPGTSGLELAREVHRRYPGLPVILASGYSHVLAEQGAGGIELLHKPYSIDQLSRVFRQALSGERRPAAAP